MSGKQRFQVKKPKTTLTYEQVYQIAYSCLIEKKSQREVAKALLIKPVLVREVVGARSHREYWIDCIADLARKGLLNG